MVAKWPDSGKSKTQLSTQLVNIGAYDDEAEARRLVEQFIHTEYHSSTSDLAIRFGARPSCAKGSLGCECVLLYAPPIDEARTYLSNAMAPDASACFIQRRRL